MATCRRFLINLPLEELDTPSRLGFQVEQAFWFYEDFYRTATPQALPKLNLRTFGVRLLQHCPVPLPGLAGGPGTRTSVEDIIGEFQKYKSHVPTCGAIILNEDLSKCLVVRGFSSKSTWGFPKGKIAKDEHPAACAAREVQEETGFDIAPYLREEEFLQVDTAHQPIRLYIIAGIPEETPFAPLTRREIRDIQWHRVSKIKYERGGPHRYFNVMPFMERLRRWIRQYRRRHGLAEAAGSRGDREAEDDMDDEEGEKSRARRSSRRSSVEGRRDTTRIGCLLGEPLEAPGPAHSQPVEMDPVCSHLLVGVQRQLLPLQDFSLDQQACFRAFLAAFSPR